MDGHSRQLMGIVKFGCLAILCLISTACGVGDVNPQTLDLVTDSREFATAVVEIGTRANTNSAQNAQAQFIPLPLQVSVLDASISNWALHDAHGTLEDFTNIVGPYADAWWFQDDGQADMVELVAVILYTEGYPSQYVRQVVGARYLWYCGGAGYGCEGKQLLNFLAYFQPWIAPETIPYGLDDPNATIYLNMAQDIVNQTGQLEAWMPGASQYVHNPNALEEGSSVDWLDAPFHFANVHDSWVPYLEWALNRGNDEDSNLWVFTMREAYIVCNGEPFFCPNMTQPRP